MPNTSSLLEDRNHIRPSFDPYSCCEMLLNTNKQWNAYLPLKYTFNHKDMTEFFKAYILLLKEKFNINIVYKIIPNFKSKGLFTYKETVEFYDKHGNNYTGILPPPTEVFSGVSARIMKCRYFMKDNFLYIDAYDFGLKRAFVKNYYKIPIYDNKDLSKKNRLK